MVAISATNSAPLSLQSSLNNTRLQQARGEAARAGAVAQDLRTRADAAESEAQQSQARVRSLASGSQAPDSTYPAQRRADVKLLQPPDNPYNPQSNRMSALGSIINMRV